MSKYGNTKTNGYDSKAEAKRGWELELLERAGKISGLQKQVRYELVPAFDGERAVDYIADFVYTDTATGIEVVEDVKGVRTDAYIIKRKLMNWNWRIKIREVAA